MTHGGDDRLARPAAGIRPVVVVVLTGGGSRRMGAHKPSLAVGGRALVARVVDAARPRPTLVVGLPDGVPDGIPVIREDPPGGGPVAALAAAVEHLEAEHLAAGAQPPELVAVLAADLPFVTGAHLDRVVDALERGPEAGLAVTTDRAGRPNWLCAVWRFPALSRRLADLAAEDAGPVAGRSLRELAAGLQRVEVPDETDLAVDVDTPDQLDAARRREAAERRRRDAGS